MTYQDWSLNFIKDREVILRKLKAKSDEEIAEYFVFENMIKNEPDFCPLYKENKKCHDITYLNCFNCGCPYFECTDSFEGLSIQNGIPVMSRCAINAKEGSQFESPAAIHHDCTNCTINHTKQFTLKQIKDTDEIL